MARALVTVGWVVIYSWLLVLGIGVFIHRVPIFWPVVVLTLSSVGFITMVIDKRRAVGNQQRISERTLLSIAALGGFAGVWIAIEGIRHKSSKPSFLRKFWWVTALHMSLAGLAFWIQNHG